MPPAQKVLKLRAWAARAGSTASPSRSNHNSCTESSTSFSTWCLVVCKQLMQHLLLTYVLSCYHCYQHHWSWYLMKFIGKLWTHPSSGCPITATGLLSQIGPAHKLFRNRPCHNCSRMSSTNCTTCCTANMSSSSLRIVLGQLTWRSQSSGYKCLKKNKKQKHGICDYLLAAYIIKGCAATAEHRVALQTILHVFTQNN